MSCIQTSFDDRFTLHDSNEKVYVCDTKYKIYFSEIMSQNKHFAWKINRFLLAYGTDIVIFHLKNCLLCKREEKVFLSF